MVRKLGSKETFVPLEYMHIINTGNFNVQSPKYSGPLSPFRLSYVATPPPPPPHLVASVQAFDLLKNFLFRFSLNL